MYGVAVQAKTIKSSCIGRAGIDSCPKSLSGHVCVYMGRIFDLKKKKNTLINLV